ncbi:MAG: Ldh family oxidoreductase [Solirubrobacteraceae bacterium]
MPAQSPENSIDPMRGDAPAASASDGRTRPAPAQRDTQATDAQPAARTVSAAWLRDAVAPIFAACGLSGTAAERVAGALVDADMRGIASHGVMLVPMYVERMRAGSVSTTETAETVLDAGAVSVLDAGNALGILTADEAMARAMERARSLGVGVVVVRHAFHFGAAFRYAKAAADDGMIGIAAANTRPLLPAPGGTRAVVGNNPLAIGVPRAGGEPIVLDMALSEAALGKIRLAEAEGRKIPPTWAADGDGVPTTDPRAALEGLLLPVGGPKGFGLALMLDVLSGVLSGGAFGEGVKGLYGDYATPNDCAHLFVAIDPGAFGEREAFRARVEELAMQVLASPRAAGVERVRLPGEIESERDARAVAEGIELPGSVLAGLREAASSVGVQLSSFAELSGSFGGEGSER